MQAQQNVIIHRINSNTIRLFAECVCVVPPFCQLACSHSSATRLSGVNYKYKNRITHAQTRSFIMRIIIMMMTFGASQLNWSSAP